MSKYSYESVHDMKDIMLGIYAEDKDYAVRYWNWVDGECMKLVFHRVKKNQDGSREICFRAFPCNSGVDGYCPDTVARWQEVLNKLDDKSDAWDAAKVSVEKGETGELMEICFTGSSNATKEVNYNLSYVDPGWRIWKFKARLKAAEARAKAKKLYGAGKAAYEAFFDKLSE